MCHQVIVETVLASECCTTEGTFEWSQASMAPEVGNPLYCFKCGEKSIKSSGHASGDSPIVGEQG